MLLPFPGFPDWKWFPCLKACLPNLALLLLIIWSLGCPNLQQSRPGPRLQVLRDWRSFSDPLALFDLLINSKLIASSWMASVSIAGCFCISMTLMAWLTPMRKHPLARATIITWGSIFLAVPVESSVENSDYFFFSKSGCLWFVVLLFVWACGLGCSSRTSCGRRRSHLCWGSAFAHSA